jgi:hypothetical protein
MSLKQMNLKQHMSLKLKQQMNLIREQMNRSGRMKLIRDEHNGLGLKRCVGIPRQLGEQ